MSPAHLYSALVTKTVTQLSYAEATAVKSSARLLEKRGVDCTWRCEEVCTHYGIYYKVYGHLPPRSSATRSSDKQRNDNGKDANF
jgi:hypothetical protein